MMCRDREALGRLVEMDTTHSSRDSVGLCARCAHAKAVVSAKGSTFWRCRSPLARAGTLPKYPPLPLWECPGFAAGEKS